MPPTAVLPYFPSVDNYNSFQSTKIKEETSLREERQRKFKMQHRGFFVIYIIYHFCKAVFIFHIRIKRHKQQWSWFQLNSPLIVYGR